MWSEECFGQKGRLGRNGKLPRFKTAFFLLPWEQRCPAVCGSVILNSSSATKREAEGRDRLLRLVSGSLVRDEGSGQSLGHVTLPGEHFSGGKKSTRKKCSNQWITLYREGLVKVFYIFFYRLYYWESHSKQFALWCFTAQREIPPVCSRKCHKWIPCEV